MNRLLHVLVLILSLALVSSAANRALLVGIRTYPNYPGLARLEGPANDATKLADILKRSWGFSTENVRLLLDEQGTRANILRSLDELIDQSVSGDRLLFFYSGHGTSFHDLATQGFGMDMRTGAIIPQDLKAGTPKEVLDSLIVGARDLRPRFTRLDQKGVEVIVLFDSCYSGDAAKALSTLVPRDGDLFARSGPAVQKDFDSQLAALIGQTPVSNTPDDWPYKKVIYISAAARHEQAWDIPLAAIRRGDRSTIDGTAHGAYTNGLLEALSGTADLDHNGQITYRELHNFLTQRVQIQHGQTPQLFPKGFDNTTVNQPVFGSTKAPVSTTSGMVETVLRVKVDTEAPQLVAALRQNRFIRFTDKDYDVRLFRDRDGLAIEHVSGGKIFDGNLDQAGVQSLLERLGEAQQVAGLRYPRQDFNVTLTVERLDAKPGQPRLRCGDLLLPNPPAYQSEPATIFKGGDCVRVSVTSDRNAYLIALDIDVEGRLTLLYPYQKSDLQQATAGRPVAAALSAVRSPFGTETLKVFAFRDKPAGYDDLIATHEFEGQEAIRKFLSIVQGDGAGRSQTVQVMYSQP